MDGVPREKVEALLADVRRHVGELESWRQAEDKYAKTVLRAKWGTAKFWEGKIAALLEES